MYAIQTEIRNATFKNSSHLLLLQQLLAVLAIPEEQPLFTARNLYPYLYLSITNKHTT